MTDIRRPRLISDHEYGPPEVTPKLWGAEELLASVKLSPMGVEPPIGYTGKRLRVNPGCMSSIHFHKLKCETFVGETATVYLDTYKLELADLFLGNPALCTDELTESMYLGTTPLSPHEPESRRITVYPLCPHRFWVPLGSMPGSFLEFSTFDTAEDSYRIRPSDLLPPRRGPIKWL